MKCARRDDDSNSESFAFPVPVPVQLIPDTVLMSAWFGEDAKRNADHGFLAGSSLTIKFPITAGRVVGVENQQASDVVKTELRVGLCVPSSP